MTKQMIDPPPLEPIWSNEEVSVRQKHVVLQSAIDDARHLLLPKRSIGRYMDTYAKFEKWCESEEIKEVCFFIFYFVSTYKIMFIYCLG